jgi:hypothetical protein
VEYCLGASQRVQARGLNDVLHDMSKEFWNALGWILIILSVVVPVTGWWLDFDHTFLFGVFVFCFMGAAYMAQLGRFSKSRKDPSE